MNDKLQKMCARGKIERTRERELKLITTKKFRFTFSKYQVHFTFVSDSKKESYLKYIYIKKREAYSLL